MAQQVKADRELIITPPNLRPPVRIPSSTDLLLIVNSRKLGFGSGVKPLTEDVELLQFYLSEFFDIFKFVIPPKIKLSKKGELVAIDGIYGDQTHSALLVFQKEHMKLRGDGIVDVPTTSFAQDVNLNGSRTVIEFRRARTILSLSQIWGENNPDKSIFDNLKTLRAPRLRAAFGR